MSQDERVCVGKSLIVAACTCIPVHTTGGVRKGVWGGQLRVSMNILIFWPHLILPIVKHPFHHLPLTKRKPGLIEGRA